MDTNGNVEIEANGGADAISVWHHAAPLKDRLKAPLIGEAKRAIVASQVASDIHDVGPTPRLRHPPPLPRLIQFADRISDLQALDASTITASRATAY